jgi:very-short-patch-repair endonuclease
MPRPRANALLGRRMPDFLFPEHRVIVEIDSWRWHGNRRSFESDADRHSRWTAQGWAALKFTPRQLRDHPLLVIARMTAALVRAA